MLEEGITVLQQTLFVIYQLIKKTGKKILIGRCYICIRKKSLTVSDNKIAAEGLGDFFMNLGKKGLNERWLKLF